MEISKIKNVSKIDIKQFLSYFCVGGIAAIVEWTTFSLFTNVARMDYLMATCAAFVFSTTANWILGRIWTFKGNNRYQGKAGKEAELIFIVSGFGLMINLMLMFLFVSVLGMNTDLLKIISKVLATGIVFIWNYLIRKIVIYK